MDLQEFENIYRQFRNQVLKYTLNRLHDREAAEELTQEVFVKVYRFRDTYEPGRPFAAWFWTLVRNATCDWKRRYDPLLLTTDEESGPEITAICEKPTAEMRLVQKDGRRGLLKKLRSLTRLQRKVIWLRLVHGYSFQDIAKQLGMSLGAVKCLCSRAKQALLTPGKLSVEPA